MIRRRSINYSKTWRLDNSITFRTSISKSEINQTLSTSILHRLSFVISILSTTLVYFTYTMTRLCKMASWIWRNYSRRIKMKRMKPLRTMILKKRTWFVAQLKWSVQISSSLCIKWAIVTSIKWEFTKFQTVCISLWFKIGKIRLTWLHFWMMVLSC